MIVDTNVLIRLMQDNEAAVRKIDDLESQHVPLRVSSVSLFELHHSIERVNNSLERRRRIEAVLESKPTYPADSTAMKKAGRIDGRLTSEGRAIGMGDTIIAATALVQEEPVLTENVKDFERIDDLEVESY